MKFGFLEILTLIGSVGLFMYGMKLMSEGLQKAAGNRLRNVLAMMTNNRFLGALTGILITALIQSSSATTVMIVSFVNAGLISLGQSMAVIMGANVGTTATAWIISLFGFKVNIAAFAIPIMAFAVPMLFVKKDGWRNWGEFLLGFAFLFMGLEFMNSAVPDFKSNPEVFGFLQKYANMGYVSVLIFALIGMIITVIIQSSSATFAIVLVMCSKGWISFEIAAALVLGSNIGTCVTPLIASISGNIWAKRAATGHMLFNLFGSIWTLVLFFPFIKLIVWITNELAGDPYMLVNYVDNTSQELVNQLADRTIDTSIPGNGELLSNFENMQFYVSFGLSMFHTIFNLINIGIMIWFTKGYVYLVTKLVPGHAADTEEESHLTFISTGMVSTAELAILQARKEIALYGLRTQRMLSQVRDLYHEQDETDFVKKFSRIQKYENISDRMEVEIATYLTKVADGRLSDMGKHQIHAKLRVVSEIESIADSCYNLARTIQRRIENSEMFTEELDANVELMFNLVDSSMEQMLVVLGADSVSISEVNKTQNLENEINNFRNQLKTQNVIDVKEGKYSYPTSVIYMDLIVECEKLGDYIVNVVESSADAKMHTFPHK